MSAESTTTELSALKTEILALGSGIFRNSSNTSPERWMVLFVKSFSGLY